MKGARPIEFDPPYPPPPAWFAELKRLYLVARTELEARGVTPNGFEVTPVGSWWGARKVVALGVGPEGRDTASRILPDALSFEEEVPW